MIKKEAFFALFLLLGASFEPAAAQTQLPAEGLVTAKRYAAVGAGRRVSVEVRNYEDASDELVSAVGAALRARGFTVVEDAALILFVDTGTNTGGDRRPTPSPPEETGLTRRPEVEQHVALPFDLTTRRASQGLRYSVTTTLSERGKPPVWIGNAAAVVSGGDRRSVFSALASAVVADIGRDVASRRFDVR